MNPEISICCITYNQQQYIKQTLDGFLKQKINVPYEILIHDDCSTDGTVNILKEYKRKYPDKIVLLLEKENQYSKGALICKTFLYPLIKGKYFCFCEGDDYWCDENKLQKQYDALEANVDCSIAVHDVACVNGIGELQSKHFPPVELTPGILPADKYLSYEIGKSLWLFQTSSFFLRSKYLKEFINNTPLFVNAYKKAEDFSLILFFLSKGNAYYINNIMSCYRIQTFNAVSQRLIVDKKFRIKQREGYIKALTYYNQYTNYKYQKYISSYQHNAEFGILLDKGEYKKAVSEYSDVFQKQTLRKKIKIILLSYIPFLEILYVKIKAQFYKYKWGKQ